jgi:hypothetical protein
VTLLRLLGGAAAVAVVLVLWDLAERKLAQSVLPFRPLVLGAESILLTMFAALWFASLGHGGWALLFAVLGVLIEGPIRLRHRAEAPTTTPWIPLLAGTARMVAAGGVLALLL